MVTIAVITEAADEPRVALSPETAKKFVALGCTVKVEAGAGLRSRFSDDAYTAAGAAIAGSATDALTGADVLLAVRRPLPETIKALKPGAIVAAIMEPFDEAEGLQALTETGALLFSMEFMPRISRAQSMDVLSSQSNLAGYKAVVDAASLSDAAMPMMMTAAGTVPAARAFIMGVGVAGLQSIATARRLGCIVTATDVRPATKEQVLSLGAKFIAVENDEFKQAETSGGYAKEMSDDYKKQQAELIAEHVKKQNLVITTALIPGRPAPKLISKAMVESMAPGAIIVDLAAERGGNCELTKPGEIVDHNGVRIMGKLNVAGELSTNASSLYAKNLLAFLSLMIDKDKKEIAIQWDDEIIEGTLLAKDGKLVHPRLVPAKAAPASTPEADAAQTTEKEA